MPLARRTCVPSLRRAARSSDEGPSPSNAWVAATQVSLTGGTILHNTKTPLTAWFWATYLTVTDKRGMPALLLQRQLGLRRYETAWMLLHKLRRAMVNAAREPLQGDVEIEFPDFKATTLMALHQTACGAGFDNLHRRVKQFTDLPVAGYRHVARADLNKCALGLSHRRT